MRPRWLLESADRVPAERSWLSAREKEDLAGLRFAKRRRDWLVGRWAAKQALAALFELEPTPAALARFAIHNDSEGAPFADRDGRPLDRRVSISHRDGLGLCAVAPPGFAIGCDLELVEPRSDAFVSDWFDDFERAWVAAGDTHARTALVWSAKESALKALGTGLRRDTRELRVEPGSATSPATWSPLRVRVAGDGVLAGWWRVHRSRMITLVARPDLAEPAALRPVPSRSASPSLPDSRSEAPEARARSSH